MHAGDRVGEIIILLGGDHAVHGALLTQDFGECTGVYAADARDVVFFQEILNGILTAEIAGNTGQLADNISVRPWSARLHILITNTIIADKRVSHNNSLSCVRRVSQDLQITGHRGIKYDFADDFAGGANTGSLEHGAIFQNKKCFHGGVPILSFIRIMWGVSF